MRASKNGSRNIGSPDQCAIVRAPGPAGVGAAGLGGFGFHYARLGISGRAARPRNRSRRVYEIVCLRGSGLDVAANYLSARERLGCSIA